MTLKQVNYSLFKAAEHLFEAGKYMMNVKPDIGIRMMQEAETLLGIIEPEQEKVPQDKLESIMAEIMNFKEKV